VPDNFLPALFSGAITFVYPSIYEGFGLPILEAMATGTPVITSDRTALPEVSQGAAVHVNPLDTADITEALHRLISDSAIRQRLRSEGLARSQQLTWDRAARSTAEVLLEELDRD
jgi:glycosyltransferase involved in cell wall biosynthesis